MGVGSLCECWVCIGGWVGVHGCVDECVSGKGLRVKDE